MTEYSYKVCPVCGIHYAVDNVVMNYKYKSSPTDKDCGWYCPNGHSLIFTEYESDILRRERDRLRQQLAQKDDEIADERRRTESKAKEIKRLERRAKAGTCPCCKRTFTNMATHIKAKHPEFATEKPKLALVS